MPASSLIAQLICRYKQIFQVLHVLFIVQHLVTKVFLQVDVKSTAV